MKNTILKTIAFAAFMAIIILPSKLNAQITGCNYDIQNNTGCDVGIDISIICSNGNVCTTSGVVLISGQMFNLTCADLNGCGPGPWDVQVTINTYDNILVSNSQTVSGPGTFSWGPCAGGVSAACCAGALFNITWTGTITTID